MDLFWWFVLVFYVGATLGFFFGNTLLRKKSYAGTLKVSEFEGKVVYLLELERDPEELRRKKRIVFAVRASPDEEDSSQ